MNKSTVRKAAVVLNNQEIMTASNLALRTFLVYIIKPFFEKLNATMP